MKYPNIPTIRYMGNKSKILDFVVSEIENNTAPGDIICDIMAGTNSIGYSLKERNIIYSNDFQFYSYVVGKALLSNEKLPTITEMKLDLDENYKLNLQDGFFTFFQENYGDTYFSREQCKDIDSLRYAIDKIEGERRYFYLTLLMSAMSKAQSSPGHFAQYMDKNHKRLIPIRALSVYKLFFEKIKDFEQFVTTNNAHKNFNLDYNKLFLEEDIKKVDMFYLDPPYTADQYSRFYHVLETITRYDSPRLSFKALYRENRKMSNFSYKSKAPAEFENIIKFARENNSSLIISYSNKGVVSIDKIVIIGKKYYNNITIKSLDYEHSTQGKGKVEVKEILIIMKRD